MLTLLRKGILVYVLILVAGGHWLTTQRTTSWDRPLSVAVYPINGDGSQRSARYIESLEWNAFKSIDQFMAELMAGRIPVSIAVSQIPDSLDKVIIGTKTAQEIRWRQ